MDIPFNPSRIGFSLDLEAENLRADSVNKILPKIELLGAHWAVIAAPKGRAIPEGVVRSLTKKGVEPVIRIPIDLGDLPTAESFLYELKAYANWGVEYVSFFKSPNLRSNWPSTGWTQKGLVSRFLDLFIPYARMAMQAGLKPIFPALEPGGDYWDTAFLRRSLEQLAEREEEEILASLVIGAKVSLNEHGIDWGSGGPERWPEAIPYQTPEGSEDHRGFRIFDWYNAISRAAIESVLPTMLFVSGKPNEMLKIAQRSAIANEDGFSELISVPKNVIAVHLESLSPKADAWFDPSQKPFASCQEWISWKTGRTEVQSEMSDAETLSLDPILELAEEKAIEAPTQEVIDMQSSSADHYVLLPTYSWGKSKFHLRAIQPFARKYQPTVGYSLSQARKAAQITIVGGTNIFTEDIIEMLKSSGCEVSHIIGEGQQIAEQLAAM